MVYLILIVSNSSIYYCISLQLLKHFKESERWMSTSKNLSANKRPIDFSPEELENELFKLFLNTRFRPRFELIVYLENNFLSSSCLNLA